MLRSTATARQPSAADLLWRGGLRDDRLIRIGPMLAMIAKWQSFFNSAVPEEELQDLREHCHSGYALGNSLFVDRSERAIGRILRPGKSGRPPKLLKQP